MSVSLIDTHCHLDFAAFDNDRASVIGQAVENGVKGIVVPGVARHEWQRTETVCAQHERLFPALGLQPLYLSQHQDEDLQRLEERVAQTRPVAIGEIGLDFFVKELDRQRQMHFFVEQVLIANSYQLPIIVHARKSHEQVLSVLKQFTPVGGVIHAYNGSLEQARQFLKLGFKLGFGGAMTYDRAKKLRRLAAELPLESLVLETDAPDMSPEKHHGERNSPEYLPEVFQTLCELRDEPPELIADQLWKNSCSLFPSLAVLMT